MAGITLDTLNSSLHSIEIKTAAGQALAIDGSGFLTANINGNVTVTATDLDIRDLAFATDSVTAHQGGTWNIGTLTSITNDVNIADGGNSITVDAVDLDIRDLSSAQDSVAAVQSGVWNVNTTPGGYGSWKVTGATVTSTESELVSVPLSGRLNILIQNLGAQDVFIKEATGVATTDLKIPKGSSFEMGLDDVSNIFAITSSGSADLRIAEFAG